MKTRPWKTKTGAPGNKRSAPRGRRNHRKVEGAIGSCPDGLLVCPPPVEDGPEPLFSVVYVIDINGADCREAAELAHRIMMDPQSLPPILHILDSRGRVTVVDLAEAQSRGGEP